MAAPTTAKKLSLWGSYRSQGTILYRRGIFNEKAECFDTKLTSFETTTRKPSTSPAACPGEGPKLRLKDRQSVSFSRPHSWHSTKLLENQANPSMMQISQGTLGSPWHQAYHSSSSASDLSSYDHGYLRRSPDQYSSRGSMESLDHTSSAYHPCHLSPAKSTNAIDQLAHLHNKRDSAYSSFSTNSSIPEYNPTAFCKERSYSMESMFSRGNLQEGIKHADIRYIKTVYDAHRGVSEEYEVNSSTVKNRGRLSGGYVRNSVGPVGRLDQNRGFSESDVAEQGPPMPPTRSDSYAVTKHHERPSSWSSLDQNRYFRPHSKGPGSHLTSATCNTNQQLKQVFGEGQLHTVMEKSPECSPLLKPKQMYSQVPQPGQPMLPAGIYPVPSPEPHFAHAPQPLKNNNGRLYPALAKEGVYCQTAASGGKGVSCSQSKSNVKSSQTVHCSSAVPYSVDESNKVEQKKEDGSKNFAHYKLHFSIDSDIPTGASSNNEIEKTISKRIHCLSKNDQQPKSESRIKTQRLACSGEHVNGNVQEFINNGNIRSQSVPAFQNDRSLIQIKPDVSTGATGMESYRNNNSIDTYKDKDWVCQYNVVSLNSKTNDRHSPLASDHRNKLDSPSFTKHIEDIDSSVMSDTNNIQSDEPSSPPHKNSIDFTRRRLSSGSNQSGNNLPHSKTEVKQRSSVLEKISKIEQREQECQKSQVSSGSIQSQNSGQCTRGTNRASINSIEELRNKFNLQEHIQAVESRRLSGSQATEKVTGVHQLKGAASAYNVKLGDIQKAAVENQLAKTEEFNDEQRLLQALPDGDKETVDSQTMPNKEDHWQSAAQDTLGFSRAYRNSIKDAQSKVLEATSYRRKDLEISPPQYKKPQRNVKRPTSAVLHKTPPVSPHAPKERHSVTPMDTFSNNQEFESQEGTGVSYQVTRIGARRRLTAEQKKRSYSEPEKMNEVGASDTESSSSIQKSVQNINFLEQTVADRRRMFERDGKASSTVNLSKPELKQLQQNALADYIERKTGRRPSSQETGFLKERSQSTYFSGSLMDNQSISSTSSMNSLQEHNMSFLSRNPREKLSKTGGVSSTLPPGLTGLFDLISLEKQSKHQDNRARSSSFVQQRLRLDYRSKTECKSTLIHLHGEITASKPTELLEVSATSHEDLLNTFDNPVSLHVRSKSTPAGENRSQDYIMKQEAIVNHTSTNKVLRLTKSKTEDHSEKATYESDFQPYTGHQTGIEGEKQVLPSNSIVSQSSMQIGNQRHTRTQSLTPTSGSHSARLVTLPSPNSRPPKIAQVSSSHNTIDFVTAEEYLYPEKNRNPDIFPDEDKYNSYMDLSLHDNSLLDYNNDKLKTKSTPPQRPPPPKMKCINLEKEGIFSQNNTTCPKSKQTPSIGWKNNTMWSSSSSEPETPTHHGKISLRISESCLQSFSPVVGHEDEDDEVFVKEQELKTFPETPFVPPSPPPFPPPSLADALFRDSQEKIQNASAVPHRENETKVNLCPQVKEDLTERYPITVESIEKADIPTESSSLNPATSSTPVRDFEHPLPGASSTSQIPQLTASSVGADQSSLKNPPTQDEATSTLALDLSHNKIPTHESTISCVSTNVMTPEDVKSQELAKEIVNKDKSLADILDPEFKMKTTMDLMGGLFMKSTNALRENNRRWIKEKMMPDKMMFAESGKKADNKNTAENEVSSSVYYSMSAPKAELLRKITDMYTEVIREEEHPDVNEKKAELIASLTHKLEILKGAKESLLVDIHLNNSLGEEVETLVENLCKPNEFDKYKMFIGDLDKVVNLLLSLSGRLAKVENVLNTLGEDANAEERSTWNVKKKQLCSQHEDARELKENLDRREKLVMDILGNYLSGEQFQDYQHFVKMKSALLIEQRELDDKIKLGQEQLNCLLESLPRDFIVGGKVPLRGENASSGNVKMLPPLTTSL